MKKIILSIISLLILFTLASCGKYKESTEIKILAPMGTPAVSQMYVQKEKEAYNYKIDLVQGADSLSAAFTSKSYDFIYAPLNLGAKMYLNNKNYKLLATVVNCNYYLVIKKDGNFTLDDIKDKHIVLFGQGQMSSIVANYIFDKNNITGLNISYVGNVAESMSAFIADNSIVALISEPQLSKLEGAVQGLKTISLKEEYTKVTKENNLPQAALFIRSDLDSNIAKRYLSNLKSSVNKVNKNIEESAELGSTLYTSFTKDELIKAIPRSEIELNDAKAAKENIEKFFSIINEYNDKLIGGTIDDEFYFKA
ncbi:hypothetical protein J6Y73_01030 [bacterium]|nr:hypothetical protein [bacterium]